MTVKKLKNIICLLLVAVMLICLAQAFADEVVPEVGLERALQKAWGFISANAGKSAEQIAAETGISVYDILSPYGTETIQAPRITVSESDTWEDIVARLLDKYGSDENEVGIGYYNLSTGEEHYINADKYIVSASMFKVPLNMIIADRVSSGEMSMDTDIYGAPYSWYQYKSIVHSDNDRSVTLINYLGGYQTYKDLQIPYLGNDPTVDLGWNYYVENYYTPREFINMMKLLYNEPERFPGVVENMLEAEPYSYFRQYEKRYPIAQKYGFVPQEEHGAWHTYINTCGIVYAPDPFCLVVFTNNALKAYDIISEYAVVMCDYNEMVSARAREIQRQKDDRAMDSALQELTARLNGGPSGALGFTKTERPVETAAAEASGGNMSVISTILIVVVAAAMLTGFVIIFRNNRAGRINAFWAVLAIVILGGGIIMGLIGLNLGTLLAKPSGDPRAVVEKFFSDIKSQNYEEAYSCLLNYSSLGLEGTPASEESRMIVQAMRESFDYGIMSGHSQEKLSATQDVNVRYLNVQTLEKNAARVVDSIIREMVNSRTRSQLYDEEGNYLPSVIDEAYRRAVMKALETPEESYSSAQLSIKLEYKDGEWKIDADQALLTALSGAAA